MLDYQVHLGDQEAGPPFSGTFSAADFTHLVAPRIGRAFDLEHYKAYVLPSGQIALMRKPDYSVCATLNLAELVNALRAALNIGQG